MGPIIEIDSSRDQVADNVSSVHAPSPKEDPVILIQDKSKEPPTGYRKFFRKQPTQKAKQAKEVENKPVDNSYVDEDDDDGLKNLPKLPNIKYPKTTKKLTPQE